MNSCELWQAFLDTGAPELYVLYSKAKRTEMAHVSDNQRAGAACRSLQ